MARDVAVKTIDDFTDQWLNFRDNPGYYGSSKLLADIFGPLLSIDDVAGMRVADIGSGTGTHRKYASRRGRGPRLCSRALRRN